MRDIHKSDAKEGEAILSWHFLSEDRRLRYGNRELVVPGQTISVEPPLQMCKHGLHASVRAIDALGYAPGPIVCRVQISGEILEEGDKLCATHRRCLWMDDASLVLHEFACWCAEECLKRAQAARKELDPAAWAAVRAKQDWLAGKITLQELAAAREAAGEAAWESAWEAARGAAWESARESAWEAARQAAWGAAWGAAMDKQNQQLEDMLLKLRCESSVEN